MFANLDIFMENVPEIGISISYLRHFRWKIRNLRSKSGSMKVRIESQDDMIEILTEIYDCRLKALIGYEDTACTREIVGYMFRLLNYIEHTYEKAKLRSVNELFLHILVYTPDADVSLEYAAKDAADKLMLKLDTYIRTCVRLLYPDRPNLFKKDAYRKELGKEFKNELKRNKHKYPQKLQQNDFFSQLNYTIQYRNSIAHDLDENFADYCIRFNILQAYDVLLSYLLYTFYYMVLKTKKDSSEPEYVFEYLIPKKK